MEHHFQKKRPFLKLAALVTLICFTSETAAAFPGAPPLEKPPGTKTVYLLLNAHASSETQRQIARLLRFFQKKGVSSIGLEGASDPIDGRLFRTFPEKNALAQAAWEMVREGKLTGAEYFYITAEKLPRFYGLEKKEFYLRNREAFIRTVKAGERIRPIVEQAERSLAGSREKILSPKLQRFLELNERFQARAVRSGEYFPLLLESAKQARVSLVDFPNLYLFSRALSESKSEISVQLTEGIHKGLFGEELEALTEKIYGRLAESKEEKDLIDKIQSLERLKSLLRLELQSKDWEQIRKTGAGEQFFATLGLSKREIRSLQEAARPALRFYALADRRDRIFAGKILRELSHSRLKATVAVVGGFHETGLREGLERAGITVVPVLPKLAEVLDDIPYRDRLASTLDIKLVISSMVSLQEKERFKTQLFRRAESFSRAEVRGETERPEKIDLMMILENVLKDKELHKGDRPTLARGQLTALFREISRIIMNLSEVERQTFLKEEAPRQAKLLARKLPDGMRDTASDWASGDRAYFDEKVPPLKDEKGEIVETEEVRHFLFAFSQILLEETKRYHQKKEFRMVSLIVGMLLISLAWELLEWTAVWHLSKPSLKSAVSGAQNEYNEWRVKITFQKIEKYHTIDPNRRHAIRESKEELIRLIKGEGSDPKEKSPEEIKNLQKAMLYISEIGSEAKETIPHLMKRLNHRSPDVREAAIMTLARLFAFTEPTDVQKAWDSEFKTRLAETLKNPDEFPKVRLAALAALTSRIGFVPRGIGDWIPLYVSLLKDPRLRGDVSYEIKNLLFNLADEGKVILIVELAALLKEPDPQVKVAALVLISDNLKPLFGSSWPAGFDKVDLFRSVIRLAGDKDPSVADAARNFLDDWDWIELNAWLDISERITLAQEAMVQFKKGGKAAGSVQEFLSQILEDLSWPGIESVALELLTLAKEGTPELQKMAIHILSADRVQSLDNPLVIPFVPSLMDALRQETDPGVRREIILIFKSMGEQAMGAVPLLIEILKEKGERNPPPVREAVTKALWWIAIGYGGDRTEILDLLNRIAMDEAEDPALRKAAKRFYEFLKGIWDREEKMEESLQGLKEIRKKMEEGTRERKETSEKPGIRSEKSRIEFEEEGGRPELRTPPSRAEVRTQDRSDRDLWDQLITVGEGYKEIEESLDQEWRPLRLIREFPKMVKDTVRLTELKEKLRAIRGDFDEKKSQPSNPSAFQKRLVHWEKKVRKLDWIVTKNLAWIGVVMGWVISLVAALVYFLSGQILMAVALVYLIPVGIGLMVLVKIHRSHRKHSKSQEGNDKQSKEPTDSAPRAEVRREIRHPERGPFGPSEGSETRDPSHPAGAQDDVVRAEVRGKAGAEETIDGMPAKEVDEEVNDLKTTIRYQILSLGLLALGLLGSAYFLWSGELSLWMFPGYGNLPVVWVAGTLGGFLLFVFLGWQQQKLMKSLDKEERAGDFKGIDEALGNIPLQDRERMRGVMKEIWQQGEIPLEAEVRDDSGKRTILDFGGVRLKESQTPVLQVLRKTKEETGGLTAENQKNWNHALDDLASSLALELAPLIQLMKRLHSFPGSEVWISVVRDRAPPEGRYALRLHFPLPPPRSGVLAQPRETIRSLHQGLSHRIQEERPDLWDTSRGLYLYTRTSEAHALDHLRSLGKSGHLKKGSKIAELGSGTGYVVHLWNAETQGLGVELFGFEQDRYLWKLSQEATRALSEQGAVDPERIHILHKNYLDEKVSLREYDVVYLYPSMKGEPGKTVVRAAEILTDLSEVVLRMKPGAILIVEGVPPESVLRVLGDDRRYVEKMPEVGGFRRIGPAYEDVFEARLTDSLSRMRKLAASAQGGPGSITDVLILSGVPEAYLSPRSVELMKEFLGLQAKLFEPWAEWVLSGKGGGLDLGSGILRRGIYALLKFRDFLAPPHSEKLDRLEQAHLVLLRSQIEQEMEELYLKLKEGSASADEARPLLILGLALFALISLSQAGGIHKGKTTLSDLTSLIELLGRYFTPRSGEKWPEAEKVRFLSAHEPSRDSMGLLPSRLSQSVTALESESVRLHLAALGVKLLERMAVHAQLGDLISAELHSYANLIAGWVKEYDPPYWKDSFWRNDLFPEVHAPTTQGIRSEVRGIEGVRSETRSKLDLNQPFLLDPLRRYDPEKISKYLWRFGNAVEARTAQASNNPWFPWALAAAGSLMTSLPVWLLQWNPIFSLSDPLFFSLLFSALRKHRLRWGEAALLRRLRAAVETPDDLWKTSTRAKIQTLRILWNYLDDPDLRVRSVAFDILETMGRELPALQSQLHDRKSQLPENWFDPKEARHPVVFGARLEGRSEMRSVEVRAGSEDFKVEEVPRERFKSILRLIERYLNSEQLGEFETEALTAVDLWLKSNKVVKLWTLKRAKSLVGFHALASDDLTSLDLTGNPLRRIQAWSGVTGAYGLSRRFRGKGLGKRLVSETLKQFIGERPSEGPSVRFYWLLIDTRQLESFAMIRSVTRDLGLPLYWLGSTGEDSEGQDYYAIDLSPNRTKPGELSGLELLPEETQEAIARVAELRKRGMARAEVRNKEGGPAPNRFSIVDAEGKTKGLIYVTPRAPAGGFDFGGHLDQAWEDFHEMAFDFLKVLEKARAGNLPVVLVVPEELEGYGPLHDQAPWIEGARVAMAWASAYFRFPDKDGRKVDVRILKTGKADKTPDLESLRAVALDLLVQKFDDSKGSPEEQIESRQVVIHSLASEAAQEDGVFKTLTFEEFQIPSGEKREPEIILPPPVPPGKKRILVTGVAGFLGSNLARRLVKEGHQVIGLDNLASGVKSNLKDLQENPNFFFKNVDVSQPYTIDGELDEIIHLASLASPPFYYGMPLETLLAGLQATKIALDLAREKKARFLFSSTSEVYGDPDVEAQDENYPGRVNPIGKRSQYDESKRGAETLIRLYFEKEKAEGHYLDARIVRIFNTYGPGMRLDDGRVITNFIQAALDQFWKSTYGTGKGRVIELYGGGGQNRSFGFVADTLEGIVGLLETGEITRSTPIDGRVVNIGNPGNFTIRELAGLVEELGRKYLGVEVPVVDVSQIDSTDPKQRQPVIERARRLFGYKPKVPLEAGLEKTFRHFVVRELWTKLIDRGPGKYDESDLKLIEALFRAFIYEALEDPRLGPKIKGLEIPLEEPFSGPDEKFIGREKLTRLAVFMALEGNQNQKLTALFLFILKKTPLIYDAIAARQDQEKGERGTRYQRSLDGVDAALNLAPGDRGLWGDKAMILVRLAVETAGQKRFRDAVPLFEEAEKILDDPRQGLNGREDQAARVHLHLSKARAQISSPKEVVFNEVEELRKAKEIAYSVVDDFRLHPDEEAAQMGRLYFLLASAELLSLKREAGWIKRLRLAVNSLYDIEKSLEFRTNHQGSRRHSGVRILEESLHAVRKTLEEAKVDSLEPGEVRLLGEELAKLGRLLDSETLNLQGKNNLKLAQEVRANRAKKTIEIAGYFKAHPESVRRIEPKRVSEKVGEIRDLVLPSVEDPLRLFKLGWALIEGFWLDLDALQLEEWIRKQPFRFEVGKTALEDSTRIAFALLRHGGRFEDFDFQAYAEARRWREFVDPEKFILPAARAEVRTEKGSGTDPDLLRWARDDLGRAHQELRVEKFNWGGQSEAVVGRQSQAGGRKETEEPLWLLNGSPSSLSHDRGHIEEIGRRLITEPLWSLEENYRDVLDALYRLLTNPDRKGEAGWLFDSMRVASRDNRNSEGLQVSDYREPAGLMPVLGNDFSFELTTGPSTPAPTKGFWSIIRAAVAYEKKYPGFFKGKVVADGGTGHGGILTALYRWLARHSAPFEKAVAVDLNGDAGTVLEINRMRNEIPREKIDFFISPYFDSLPPDAKFDVLFINPNQMPTPEEKEWESQPAAEASRIRWGRTIYSRSDHYDGLHSVRLWLQKAIPRLRQDGVIFLQLVDRIDFEKTVKPLLDELGLEFEVIKESIIDDAVGRDYPFEDFLAAEQRTETSDRPGVRYHHYDGVGNRIDLKKSIQRHTKAGRPWPVFRRFRTLVLQPKEKEVVWPVAPKELQGSLPEKIGKKTEDLEALVSVLAGLGPFKIFVWNREEGEEGKIEKRKWGAWVTHDVGGFLRRIRDVSRIIGQRIESKNTAGLENFISVLRDDYEEMGMVYQVWKAAAEAGLEELRRKKAEIPLQHAGTKEDPVPDAEWFNAFVRHVFVDQPKGEKRFAVFQKAVRRFGETLPELKTQIDELLKSASVRLRSEVRSFRHSEPSQAVKNLDLKKKGESIFEGADIRSEVRNSEALDWRKLIGSLVPAKAAEGQEQYRLEELIGQGGQGVIFKALNLATQEIVAVKIIHLGGKKMLEGINSLTAEAEALRKLMIDHWEHAPAIKSFGFIDKPSLFWMAMDYLGGENLKEWAVGRPAKKVVWKFLELLDIIETLHQLGVIHRDLKPSHMRVLPDQGLKLIDFGLSHIREEDLLSKLRTFGSDLFAGTHAYQPPMGWLSIQEEEGILKAELYALGVTLFELANGSPLWEGWEPESFAMFFYQHTRMPNTDEIKGKLPGDWEPAASVIAEAISEHYTSARQMKDALSKLFPSRSEARKEVTGEKGAAEEASPVPFADFGRELKEFLDRDGKIAWQAGRDRVEADLKFVNLTEIKVEIRPTPEWLERYPDVREMLKANQSEEGLRPGRRAFGQFVLGRYRFEDGREALMIDEIQPGDGYRRLSQKRRRRLNPWRRLALRKMAEWAKSRNLVLLAMSDEVIKTVKRSMDEYEIETNYREPFKDSNQWEKHPLRLNRPFGPEGVRSWYVHRSSPAPIEMDRVSSLSQTERPALWVGLWNIVKSRITSGRSELRKKKTGEFEELGAFDGQRRRIHPANLTRLFQKTERFFKEEWAKTPMSIEFNSEGSILVRGPIREEDFRFVLDEIVDNARERNLGKGPVRVRLISDRQSAKILITNRGNIPWRELRRRALSGGIFRHKGSGLLLAGSIPAGWEARFKSLRPSEIKKLQRQRLLGVSGLTTNNLRNNGQGLYLTRRILRKWGARLKASSRKGQTTFSILFPLPSDTHSHSDHLRSANAASSPRSEVRSAPPRGLRRTGARAEVRNAVTHRAVVMDPNEDISGPAGGTLELSEALKGEPSLMLQLSPDTALRKGSLEALKKAFPQIESVRFTVFVSDKETGRMDPLARVIEAQAKRAHASNLKFFVEVLPARQIQGKDPKTWFPSGGTFRNMAIANWEARSVIHFIEILVQNFKINVDGLILPFPFNVTEHLHTRGDAKKLMRKLLQNAGETPLIWLQGRNPDLVVALELAENLALEIKQESKSKPVLLGYVTEVEGRDHVHFTGEIPFPRSEVRMMESKVSHSVEEAMRLDAEQFYLADKEPGMKPFIWPEDEKIQEDILNAAKGVPPGLPAIGLGTSELNHFAPSLISSVKFPRFDLVDLYPEATEEALRKRKQDDLIRQGKVHVIGTDLSMIAPEFYAKINKAIDSSSGAFAAIKELADLFESETEDGKVIRPDLPDPLKEREGSYGLVVSGMLLHHMSATFRQAILRRLRDRFRIPEKVILSLLAENPKFDHAVMNIQIQMMKAHAELVKKLLHPSGVGYVSSFIVRWDDKSRLPMAEREGKTRQVTPEWLAFDFGIIARIYQGAPSPAIGKEEAERRPSLLAQLSSADAASPGTTGVRWSIPWSLLNTSDSPWSQGTEQLHTSIRSSQGDRGLAQSLTFRLRPPRSEVRENDRKVSSSGLRVTGLTRGDNLEHVTSSSELPYSQRAEVRTEGRKVLDFIERQLRGGQGAERFLRKRGFVFGWREIDELLDRLGMGTLEAPFEIQHRRETFQVMTEKDLINRILFELDKNHRDHVYPAPAAKASLLARKIREKGKGALEVIAVNDGPEINPIQARVSGASRSGEPGRGKGFPWISTLVLSDELGYFEVITSREGLRFLPGALEPEPVSSRVQQGTFIRVVRFLSRERARRPLETQIGDWKGKKRRMKSVLLVGRENHVEPLDLDVLVLGSPPSKTLVTEVPEAKEASGKLAGASFDLIVLDGLSQGENHDLLAGLRTARETRPPPVILIGSPYSVPEKFADDPETFFIVGSMLTGVTQNVGKVIEALQAKPLRSEARAGKVIQPLKMTPVSHRRFVRNILKEHPFEKHRLQVDMSPDLDHWDGRLVALWNYPENADRRWPNSLLSLYWLRGRKILQIPIPGKDQGSIPVGWTSTVPRAWYRVYSTPNGLRLVTMNEANRVSLFKINFSSDVPAAVRIPLAGKLFFQARVSIGDEEYRVETEGAGETLVVAREVSRKGEESENRFDFSNGSLIENSSSSSRSEPRAEVRGEEKRAEVLKELVRQSKQLVETKKMLYDGPELLEFYRTLVRLLKAAGLFRDHTIISPAGGIDGVFAAEGVDTVLLNDGDKSGLARKLVKEHWKSPEPLNDHLRYVSGTDVRKVRRYDEWTGTIRTSHRTLLFKGIRNYVFRAEPQEFERYLQAIDQYLKPGDRILFLNYLDIQDSRHFFLGTHDGRYRLVEDWLPGGGMTELKRAVQRMHEHFLVPSMDYKHNLLIPNGFLLIEKMGSDRAWLAGPEVRKAEMQSDVRRSETRTVENPDRVNSDLVRFFLEELMKNEEMRALFEKLKAGLENSTEAAKPPDAKQHFNYLKRYFVDRQSYQAIQPENPAQVKEYVSRDIKRLGRLSEMHAFRERVLQAVEKLARDQALSREQADLFKTRFNVGAPESRTENETLDLVNRGRGSVVSRARLQNSVDFVARKLKEAFGIPEVRPVLSLEAEQEIKGLLLELRPEEVRIVVERLKGIDSKRLLSGYPVSQEDLKLFWMWFGPKQKGPVQMKEQKLVRNIEEAQQRIRNLLYYLEKHLLERTAEGHFKWKEPLPARVDGSISTAAVKSLLKYRLISVLELEILLRSQEGYQAVPTLERDLLILKTYFYGVPSDIRAATKKSTFHAIIQSWLGRLAEDPFVRGRFKRIQQALKELAQEDSVSGEILRQLLEGRTQPDAKNRKALEKALTRLKEIVQRDNPRRVRIMFKTLALLAGGRTDRFLQIAERLVEQAREKRGQAWTRGRKPEWEKALSRAFQKFLKGREFTREERGRLYELETRFAEIKLEVKPLKAATAAWERPVDGDEPPGPGRGKLELTDEEEDLKEEEDDPEWREKFLEDIAEEGDRSEVRQGGISFLRLGPEEVEALRDPEKAETRQLFDALVILAGKGERVVLAVSTGEEARFLNQQINEFFLRTDTGLDRSARGRIQARHDVSNPGYKAILDAEKIWNEVKVITDRKEAESLAVWLESRGDTGIQLIVSEGRVIGIQAEEIRASLLMKAGLLVISGLEASHRYLRPDGNPQIFIPTEEGSLVARQMLDEVFLHNLKSQA